MLGETNHVKIAQTQPGATVTKLGFSEAVGSSLPALPPRKGRLPGVKPEGEVWELLIAQAMRREEVLVHVGRVEDRLDRGGQRGLVLRPVDHDCASACVGEGLGEHQGMAEGAGGAG